jgi:hypothetical protein
MFKRRAAGQRIFPSEMATHSMPASAQVSEPPSPASSIGAQLDFLNHVGDEERQPPPIQYSGPSSFAKSGFLFRRRSIKR